MRMKTGLAVTTLLAGISMAISLAEPKDARKDTLHDIEMCCLATVIYSSDYDDVLPWPQDMTTVKAVTYPYVKNIGVWKSHNPNGGEFQFNMNLGGALFTSLKEPAKIPLYFESKPWPDQSRAVAYCDGNASFSAAGQWNAQQKYMKPKFKRAAKKPLPRNHLMQYLKDLTGGGRS